ncbi:MAG: hypothetical protein MRZ79_01115 [Bacteroidia bacterium]|nr:hypothetical protein [Bacteroidia bacterium]
MKAKATLFIILFPALCFSQLRTHVGVNVPAALMGTLDLRSEIQLAPKFSLQLGSAIRHQNNELRSEPRIRALSNYVNLFNQGVSISIGGRLYEQDLSDYQYPFIAFDLTGVYYREWFVESGGTEKIEVEDFRIGGTATIGFVVRITEYINADLGIQFGYSPPREDLLAYYYPGIGYMTFGLGALGVKGGHIQPLISFRYNIIRDKRQRIHSME